jgi:hypothetical protein
LAGSNFTISEQQYRPITRANRKFGTGFVKTTFGGLPSITAQGWMKEMQDWPA